MASLPNLKKIKTSSDAKRTERKGKKNDSKLPREDITFLLMNTRFSEQEIREWYQNFSEECPEGKLDKERILNIYAQIAPLGNAKDFVDQIFRIFDEDGNGTIDFKEFMIATDMTESGTPEEKLRWAFKMYDKDNSGTVELNEMVEVMTALHSMEGKIDVEAAEATGKRVFSELDINDDGEVTIDEFVRGCMHDQEIMRKISKNGANSGESGSH